MEIKIYHNLKNADFIEGAGHEGERVLSGFDLHGRRLNNTNIKCFLIKNISQKKKK